MLTIINSSSSLARIRRHLNGLTVAICVVCTVFALNKASGEDRITERTYKGESAVAINVGIFTDLRENCTPAPLPVIRLIVAPRHGEVIVKRTRLQATNLNECLATDLPAFVAYYRSVHDYGG